MTPVLDTTRLAKKLSKKNTINNRLGKISNKIYLQNKYIRNDKELLEILKLILNKRTATGYD